MTESIDRTLHKHIRILPGQWERLEADSAGSPKTANRLLVELAMEALDRRELLDPEARLRIARASLFTAQAIARLLIADGRESEVQEIRDYVSSITPDPDTGGTTTGPSREPDT